MAKQDFVFTKTGLCIQLKQDLTTAKTGLGEN